ncbi:mitochondrial protein-like protein Fmp25 [Delphinella strobiligena]|nr:mitochondrial protein-like protein Fmp25 [Delphinella strobiligena]
MLPKRANPTSLTTPITRAASTRAFLHSRLASKGGITATASVPSYAGRQQQRLVRSLAFVTFAGGLATLSQYYLRNGSIIREAHAEAPPEKEETELIYEKSRKKAGASKEETRDAISSQHLQVKRSWENPGVYAWGSNSGRVVAPDSKEAFIKTPRRIKYFDGKIIRDIKLDRNFGAAIDEQGNLLQWGVGYSADSAAPVPTLRGKDLVSLAVSKDRILALSSSGRVYTLPVSAEDQASGTKPSESSWIPFWSSSSPVSYRTLEPKGLAWNEKVKTVSGGLEHALLLTNKGRVFSAASASDSFPDRGQMGIPGLTWLTKPAGPYDQPHEITTLRGFDISNIAAGDFHSLALDKEGRLFSFGDNSSGQLGFDYTAESAIVDTPALVPTQRLYTGTSQVPRVTDVMAGGNNSYMTVEATKVASRGSDSTRGIGRVTADTFAFGTGIYGSLGNSRWTHVQSTPAKIPAFSSLFEYDEANSTTIPIRLARLSAGATHAAAVMANVTYLGAHQNSTENDTNWGADILFWGGNEHYQLGTGKRNNVNTPTYIQPLDQAAERKIRGKEEHRFQITPRTTVKLSDGRKVSMEQRVECGRGCTAVYSGV